MSETYETCHTDSPIIAALKVRVAELLALIETEQRKREELSKANAILKARVAELEYQVAAADAMRED